MRKSSLSLIYILAVLFLGFASCENNNEVDLYGVDPCDLSNLTWDNGISQIFNANCVSCHNAETNYKDVRHDSYEEELKVISDGGERLRSVINHRGNYERMPFELPKLSPCNIQKIETWLDNGAPEK